jgi:hypothetical protein
MKLREPGTPPPNPNRDTGPRRYRRTPQPQCH